MTMSMRDDVLGDAEVRMVWMAAFSSGIFMNSGDTRLGFYQSNYQKDVSLHRWKT